MNKRKSRDEIITAYRKLIEDRYSYVKLSTLDELPSTFTEEKIKRIREYFLSNIYPDPSKRKEIDKAFAQLDNHIKHPQQLLKIVADSASLIFKYGRHLPKILKAGIRALRSFRSAARFENDLAEQAIKLDYEPPYSHSQIKSLIRSLERSQVDAFIEEGKSLFEILYERKLVKKIIDVVQHLIDKMEKRPNVYTEDEINGFKIGRNIIVEGDKLFESLDKDEQAALLDFVIDIEQKAIEDIFNA